MDKETSAKILSLLAKEYPDAKPALHFKSPFELLVAVILSAQCTDVRVNVVTDKLFQTYNSPEHFAKMSQEQLEKLIFTCGFYRDKAAHIISSSKSILQDFGGEVPNNLKDLQTLAGVGRKTANVVYSVAFHGDAIAVDTHVFRVSNRIGLASAKDVLKTELQLMENIDKSLWSKSHHLLIYHGRTVCKSQKPLCGVCVVKDYCSYYQNGGNHAQNTEN